MYVGSVAVEPLHTQSDTCEPVGPTAASANSANLDKLSLACSWEETARLSHLSKPVLFSSLWSRPAELQDVTLGRGSAWIVGVGGDITLSLCGVYVQTGLQRWHTSPEPLRQTYGALMPTSDSWQQLGPFIPPDPPNTHTLTHGQSQKLKFPFSVCRKNKLFDFGVCVCVVHVSPGVLVIYITFCLLIWNNLFACCPRKETHCSLLCCVFFLNFSL